MSAELWQAVLVRTVADAVIGVTNESKRHNRVRLCEEARHYLTTPSRDLAQVCTLAGMEMDAVIDRMRKQIANAPTPEELADNPRQSIATFTKAPAKPKLPKEARIPFAARLYTIDGITRTASEWCDLSGVKLQTANWRINQSWAPERAFTLTAQQARYEQRLNQSFNAASAEQRAKIKEGLHRSEALHGKPKQGTAPFLYEHNGETRSLAEWSEITGIGKTTLYARITRQGMTFAEAITAEVSKGRKAA